MVEKINWMLSITKYLSGLGGRESEREKRQRERGEKRERESERERLINGLQDYHQSLYQLRTSHSELVQTYLIKRQTKNV